MSDFNNAISSAGNNIMAVCYHNGCREEEDAWDGMKSQYPSVHMYKVNTLNSDDIKNKYADGGSKPYFKFYRNGNLQDEVKYKKPWSSNESFVRDSLSRHNGGGSSGGGSYSSSGKVKELVSMSDFNSAISTAGSNVMAVCYHNGCRTEEDSWDEMKSSYPKVHMYKVNTLNSDDIKNKYADGGSKPYFKFYRNGSYLEEVKYKKPWSDNKPKVEQVLGKYNGGSGGSIASYEASLGKVYELRNMSEFSAAVQMA